MQNCLEWLQSTHECEKLLQGCKNGMLGNDLGYGADSATRQECFPRIVSFSHLYAYKIVPIGAKKMA